MFDKGSARHRLFSPSLENAVMGSSSKDGSIPKSLADKLTPEESEALMMYNYKQHGILPNQYHYSYNDGDTIIFPEHVRDLVIIDKMMSNKIRKEQEKEEAKHNKNKNNPLKGDRGLGAGAAGNSNKGAGFYGHTFRFNSS